MVMMTITLLAALGAALTLATIAETAIAANYRDGTEAFYAAEAAVEFVVQEIADVPDWTDVVAEPGRSAFVDGPADGMRDVGAVTLDLAAETRDVAIAAGAAGPALVLYAFGRLEDLVPSGSDRPRIYVAVWVADRSSTPVDGTPASEALSILGQAYGTRGSRRTVETIVARVGPSAIRALSWRELR